MFGCLLFVSTCLTVFYSFRLFYFVLCADFNFVPPYSVIETNYNIMFGITGIIGSTSTSLSAGSIVGSLYPKL
jgi:hypothetical protein